jgi:hypothetical protein
MPTSRVDRSLSNLGIGFYQGFQQALKTGISIWSENNKDEAAAEDLDGVHIDPVRGLVYSEG